MLSEHNKSGFSQTNNQTSNNMGVAQYESKAISSKSEWQTTSTATTTTTGASNFGTAMMNAAAAAAAVMNAAQMKSSAHSHQQQQMQQQIQYNGTTMNGGAVVMPSGNEYHQAMYQITPTLTAADHQQHQSNMLTMVDSNQNPQLMQLLGESAAAMMKQTTAAK